MLIGAAIAFLVIFGLFLSMLSGSPKMASADEWALDGDNGQELLGAAHDSNSPVAAAEA